MLNKTSLNFKKIKENNAYLNQINPAKVWRLVLELKIEDRMTVLSKLDGKNHLSQASQD